MLKTILLFLLVDCISLFLKHPANINEEERTSFCVTEWWKKDVYLRNVVTILFFFIFAAFLNFLLCHAGYWILDHSGPLQPRPEDSFLFLTIPSSEISGKRKEAWGQGWPLLESRINQDAATVLINNWVLNFGDTSRLYLFLLALN